MKILLVTQWYKPIKGAVKRMARMADHLAEKGQDVTVLTGFPSKPTGILPPKYHGKFYCWERDGKVKILRTYEFPTPNRGVFKRVLNYFSFMISASIACLFLPKVEIVIVSSPSFFAGVPGLLTRQIFKARFFFDVRDLWPDSAIDMGLIKKNGISTKFMEILEKIFYRCAEKITTATPAIRRHIIEEGINENKVSVLLNSTDTDFFKSQKVDRKEYGFNQNDFICCYTGSMSSAQDLATIVKAAEILKNKKDIKFLFAGEGDEKEKLIAYTQKQKMKNCVFLPQQEPKTVVKLINLSDLGIVPILNSKILKEAMPSKSSEYLACGKPIIASTLGELKKIIEEKKVGKAYVGGKPASAAQAVLEIYQSKDRKKMSQRARKAALDIFSDKKFYQNFLGILDLNSRNVSRKNA